MTQFFLPGPPPTTTAQTREARVIRGKPHFYKPDRLLSAERYYLDALGPHRPSEPYRVGLRLVVKWCFPLARGHRAGQYKLTRPDTDNLQKLLKDCMTQCGFWTDDSLVCSEIVEKFWSDVPGVFIRIEEVDP